MAAWAARDHGLRDTGALGRGHVPQSVITAERHGMGGRRPRARASRVWRAAADGLDVRSRFGGHGRAVRRSCPEIDDHWAERPAPRGRGDRGREAGPRPVIAVPGTRRRERQSWPIVDDHHVGEPRRGAKTSSRDRHVRDMGLVRRALVPRSAITRGDMPSERTRPTAATSGAPPQGRGVGGPRGVARQRKTTLTHGKRSPLVSAAFDAWIRQPAWSPRRSCRSGRCSRAAPGRPSGRPRTWCHRGRRRPSWWPC